MAKNSSATTVKMMEDDVPASEATVLDGYTRLDKRKMLPTSAVFDSE